MTFSTTGPCSVYNTMNVVLGVVVAACVAVILWMSQRAPEIKNQTKVVKEVVTEVKYKDADPELLKEMEQTVSILKEANDAVKIALMHKSN